MYVTNCVLMCEVLWFIIFVHGVIPMLRSNSINIPTESYLHTNMKDDEGVE